MRELATSKSGMPYPCSSGAVRGVKLHLPGVFIGSEFLLLIMHQPVSIKGICMHAAHAMTHVESCWLACFLSLLARVPFLQPLSNAFCCHCKKLTIDIQEIPGASSVIAVLHHPCFVQFNMQGIFSNCSGWQFLTVGSCLSVDWQVFEEEQNPTVSNVRPWHPEDPGQLQPCHVSSESQHPASSIQLNCNFTVEGNLGKRHLRYLKL